MNPKTILHLLPRAGKVVKTMLAMRQQEVLPTREHLRLCADWLLHVQEQDGGYAASRSRAQTLATFITG